jgi:hypothetical protein
MKSKVRVIRGMPMARILDGHHRAKALTVVKTEGIPGTEGLKAEDIVVINDKVYWFDEKEVSEAIEAPIVVELDEQKGPLNLGIK